MGSPNESINCDDPAPPRSCTASIKQVEALDFTTASLYGSKDALAILHQICTPASLLFDPKYTSRQRPSPLPPFRTFPPSPTAQRLPIHVPSTISVRNLDNEEEPVAMDKRHPSSFQQLEKLGEGTYATVCRRRGRIGTEIRRACYHTPIWMAIWFSDLLDLLVPPSLEVC